MGFHTASKLWSCCPPLTQVQACALWIMQDLNEGLWVRVKVNKPAMKYGQYLGNLFQNYLGIDLCKEIFAGIVPCVNLSLCNSLYTPLAS